VEVVLDARVWDVRNPARTAAVQLVDEQYDRLVIEIGDPDATVEAIDAAVEHFRQAAA
jgi:hypothetical protein